MEAFAERQEFSRFIPKDNAFVAIAQAGRMGSIEDISLCGLSWSVYVGFGEREAIGGKTATSLPADIFISGKKFFLNNISCRVAYPMT